mmetsp:Transcript_21782/g.36052  ORF Transcript_21782/g.36052 Transcript_21782/m.36052 type:complete len:371 (-) Transcript_21782:471-1583(-)
MSETVAPWVHFTWSAMISMLGIAVTRAWSESMSEAHSWSASVCCATSSTRMRPFQTTSVFFPSTLRWTCSVVVASALCRMVVYMARFWSCPPKAAPRSPQCARSPDSSTCTFSRASPPPSATVLNSYRPSSPTSAHTVSSCRAPGAAGCSCSSACRTAAPAPTSTRASPLARCREPSPQACCTSASRAPAPATTASRWLLSRAGAPSASASSDEAMNITSKGFSPASTPSGTSSTAASCRAARLSAPKGAEPWQVRLFSWPSRALSAPSSGTKLSAGSAAASCSALRAATLPATTPAGTSARSESAASNTPSTKTSRRPAHRPPSSAASPGRKMREPRATPPPSARSRTSASAESPVDPDPAMAASYFVR